MPPTATEQEQDPEWCDSGRTGPDLYHLLIGLSPILALFVLLGLLALFIVLTGGG